ncbi:MAG: alpha/beta hydrolase [Gammaproteobacteria bacterium]|nr:alpha/beta hydrolase [Gammaproteobacteria bacterium]
MTSTTQQLCSYGNIGLRIAGQGEPLILLHGVGMQSAAWEPQLQALQQDYKVYAIDMPGHGQSTTLPTAARLPEYIAWLDAVMDSLQLNQVNLAGHSMGALIASGYAVTYPHRIKRVALINSVFNRTPDARQAVTARAAAIRQGEINITGPLARWFHNTPDQETARHKVAQWLQSVNPQGYATAYTAFAEGDGIYSKDFQHITCPLLAITGSDDPNSTPAMSQAIARQVSNGEAVIINGHRHMINITAPERVNAELTRWLQRPINVTNNHGDHP